jgi:septal ring-binding cell division protein DamX
MPDQFPQTLFTQRRLTACIPAIALALLVACAGPETKPADQTVVEDAHILAQAAYRAGQYSQTLTLLAPLAQRGDPEAQYVIGYMTYYGQGVPRNTEVARQWIGQAATQGHEKARLALEQFHPPPVEIEDSTLTPPATTPPPSSALQPRSVAPVDNTNPAPSAAASPAAVDNAPNVSSQPLPAQPPAAAEEQVTTSPEVDPGSVTFAKVEDEKPADNTTAAAAPRQPAPWDKPAAASLHTNDWIRAQPAQSYTIQLLAGKDRQRMVSFIEQNAIGEQAAYFHLSRNGESWYGVVYGSYPGYSLAQAALKQMNPALLKHSPWIREFSGIQGILSP